MGDHFPHKVAVDAVCRAGAAHLPEHGPHDFFDPVLVAAQILLTVGPLGAGALDLTHIFDAFCLFLYNLGCDILDRYIGSVFENIARHVDCGLMVGDHLYDKIVGYAVGQLRLGHTLNHLVQDTAKGG